METQTRTHRWPAGLIECFLVVIIAMAASWWWTQPEPGSSLSSNPRNVGLDGEASSATRPNIDVVVDINHADMMSLAALPGLGPVTAKRIIDDRNAHGRFTSTADLTRVKGIGDKKLAQLKPWITCDPGVATTQATPAPLQTSKVP